MKTKTIVLLGLLSTIVACKSANEQETKLLSKDNRHIIYLYSDSAEIYSGMSQLAEFDVTVTANDVYVLTPNSGKYTELKLAIDPKTGKWSCPACPKQKLDATWIEQ